MNGPSALRTYRNVGAQSALADSTPHQLILMLIDGAIEKTASAAGQMLHGDTAEKGRLISGSISIIDSLRASLDRKLGGQLAESLDQLYDYMLRRLLQANVNNDPEALGEVLALLKQVREAWAAIPQEYRGAGRGTVDGNMFSFSEQ